MMRSKSLPVFWICIIFDLKLFKLSFFFISSFWKETADIQTGFIVSKYSGFGNSCNVADFLNSFDNDGLSIILEMKFILPFTILFLRITIRNIAISLFIERSKLNRWSCYFNFFNSRLMIKFFLISDTYLRSIYCAFPLEFIWFKNIPLL